MKKVNYMLNRVQAAQGMRTRVQFKADKVAAMKASLFVVMFALILMLLGLCWVQYTHLVELTKQLEQQVEQTTKYSSLLASVMNGGTLYDRASDTAYFFDKPLAVKLGVK